MKKTCEKLSGTLAVPIVPGETLLFVNEIEASKAAIMTLRHVEVVPLYALSNLRDTPEDYRNMISKGTMGLMKG